MKTIAKQDLPTKICPTCKRPFAWRKRWAKVWHEVRYCSARCRRAKTADRRLGAAADGAD